MHDVSNWVCKFVKSVDGTWCGFAKCGTSITSTRIHTAWLPGESQARIALSNMIVEEAKKGPGI